jgi:toxin ParE1/3/4
VAFKVVLAPSASDDLFSIYVYVAEAAGTLVADAYDARLRGACLKLGDFPGRGTPREELAPGLRSISFERRVTIYYRLVGSSVEIVRILHKGRLAQDAFPAG